MPAPAGGTEAASGGLPPPPPMEPKSEWWASPAVVGLMGFGTTTMIAGLSNLPEPYVNGFNNNWVVYGMALAFGGVAQLIAGLIALRKGNLFAGSAFVGYGSFWIAFTLMLSSFAGQAGTINGVPAPIYYGVAGFAFIWMLFTFSFMINAPKHGWGITLVFVFLFVAFVLLVIKFWSLAAGVTATGNTSPFAGSGADNWLVGGVIIATGLIAWYVATAILTNWNYGRKVLPE